MVSRDNKCERVNLHLTSMQVTDTYFYLDRVWAFFLFTPSSLGDLYASNIWVYWFPPSTVDTGLALSSSCGAWHCWIQSFSRSLSLVIWVCKCCTWLAVETTKVADLITGLLEKTNVTMGDIGVMAPYRRQVTRVFNECSDSTSLQYFKFVERYRLAHAFAMMTLFFMSLRNVWRCIQVQKLRLVLRSRKLGAIRVGTVDDYQVPTVPYLIWKISWSKALLQINAGIGQGCIILRGGKTLMNQFFLFRE